MREEENLKDEKSIENKEGAKGGKEVIVVLLKALKALKIYPSNSPLLEKFLGDLHQVFERYFSSYESLRLNFTKSSIISFGLPVYQNEEKDDNLAFLFFADGITEFEMSEDITKEELNDFVKILNQAFTNTLGDNDLVTLLWGRDFKFIRYKIKEDYLEDEVDIDVEMDRLLSRSTTYSGRLEDAYSKALEEAGKKDEAVSVYGEDNEVIEIKLPDKNSISLLAINEDDVAYITSELKRCGLISPQQHIARILFYILNMTTDPDEYREVATYLQKVLEKYIEIADFESSNSILENINLILEKNVLKEEQKSKLKEIIQFAGNEKNIGNIGILLNSGFDANLKSLKTFISYLDKNSVINLCKLLSELEDIHHRKIMIDMLVEKCRGEERVLYRWLSDQRWYVVRNIVHVLGRIGGEDTIEALKKTLHHSEVRVRREVLNALATMRSVKLEDAFLEAINDSDESIRVIAVKHLGRIGGTKTRAYLKNLIDSKPFEQKSIEEKKDFCLAYAKIGGKEGVGFLGDFLKRKSFFNKAKLDEMKISAAYGLSYSNDPESIKFLEFGADSKNEEIKRLSLEGIKRLKTFIG